MFRVRSLTFLAYALTLLLLLLVFFIGKHFEIPFYHITADPAFVYKFHPFIGILSNIGIILWCLSLTCCYFSSAVIWNSDKTKSRFLLFSGLVTTMLLFDDFFMFHDYLLHFLESSIPVQPAIYLFYGFIMLLWGTKFVKVFKGTRYLLLVAAMFFFGSSMIMDLILPNDGLQYFFEDSSKFLGIVSWTMYFSHTSFQFVKEEGTPE